MCDTLVVAPDFSAESVMLFGKNSDRQRNEAQRVLMLPARNNSAADLVQCTYVTIAQARQTYAVLLSQPFWIWGAEMGANDQGVVIGNEGVHAKSPAPEDRALLGMDLLRLGLERGASAPEALDVITRLLSQHGQGGNCGHLTPSFYNNSFLIADPQEAWVLETVGRDWVAKRVERREAISNQYGIGREPDLLSNGLDGLITAEGWAGAEQHRDYAETIANHERQHIGQARPRRRRALELLDRKPGDIVLADVISALRDHGSAGAPDPRFNTHVSICMHAGSDRNAQTTASLASELLPDRQIHWVTGSAAPCLSIFKPIVFGAEMPVDGSRLNDRFDAKQHWWRQECLHRAALDVDFLEFIGEISALRDTTEAKFRDRIAAAIASDIGPDAFSAVMRQCWTEAQAIELGWQSLLASRPKHQDERYRARWTYFNDLAGLPEPGQ